MGLITYFHYGLKTSMNRTCWSFDNFWHRKSKYIVSHSFIDQQYRILYETVIMSDHLGKHRPSLFKCYTNVFCWGGSITKTLPDNRTHSFTVSDVGLHLLCRNNNPWYAVIILLWFIWKIMTIWAPAENLSIRHSLNASATSEMCAQCKYI